MKNREKYVKEIAEIICDGYRVAVLHTGKIVHCKQNICSQCKFYTGDGRLCKEVFLDWANQEDTIISMFDRIFLNYLDEKYQYIARDLNGNLYIYPSKPKKCDSCWDGSDPKDPFMNIANTLSLESKIPKKLTNTFTVEFPMVKWKDKEAWKIEDLKNLEIVSEYE